MQVGGPHSSVLACLGAVRTAVVVSSQEDDVAFLGQVNLREDGRGNEGEGARDVGPREEPTSEFAICDLGQVYIPGTLQPGFPSLYIILVVLL